jgi:site-specific recombinase XerD
MCVFEDYIEIFMTHLENLNRSDETLKQYKKELNAFHKFLKEKSITKPADIDAIHIDLYQNSLIKKGNSPSSRAKKSSVLKSFFKYLYSRKYMKTNPTDALDPIKIKDVDQKKREVLTIDESLRLIDRMTKNSIPSQKLRNRCILHIFLFCGLRVSELVDLKFDDVDFKNKTIYVRGKGGKIREVPLFDGQMMTDLKDLKKEKGKYQEYLFTRKNSDEPITTRGMHDLIKRHVEKARINKNIGCHSLRRTAASNLLASGVNLRHIQIYLGHSDISTTMRYLNPDKEEVKQDIRNKNILSKKMKKLDKKKP